MDETTRNFSSERARRRAARAHLNQGATLLPWNSDARFKALVQNSTDIITIHDATGTTIFESPSASRVLGRPPGTLIGHRPFESIHPRDLARVREAFDSVVQHGQEMAPVEFRYRHANGSWIWLEAVGNNLIDLPGVGGVVLTSRDITRRKAAEGRIEYLAHHDFLTDLPNRALMRDRLDIALSQALRWHHTVAALFIDLDRFKVVNDTLGHAVADVVLQRVAERLKHCTREGDTVARVGGDEFMVVLPNLASPQGAAAVAQKVLRELEEPMQINGREVFVSGSIGISVFPADTTNGDALIQNADTAMYSAKRLGRNSYQFYTADLNAEMQERLAIEQGLRLAEQRNELHLVYQPKIDLGSRKIIGVEALLRWHSAKLGPISPDRFIPIAEETGLIAPIGEWVLRTACRTIRQWRDEGIEMPVAVNLSARQFRAPNLADTINGILSEFDVPPEFLEIEITESDVMENAESAIATLGQLKAKGVNISIDDFGTGYSSLSYLKRFPLDTLKIDRSFISNVATDSDDAAIVAAIIALANSLELKVVAEGVETEAQVEFLNRCGCDFAQGYLFSSPVAPEKIPALLDTNAAPNAAS
jgi:diguanylate cyclase (GGDEF)-like protein/PAS domain S-box-containing protein